MAADPEPAATVASLPAPVLSARRAPAALAADATRQRYLAVLSDVTSGIEGDGASCFAASLDGTPVLEVGADRLVVPASNMKLITGAVALEVLGADHGFSTAVLGTLVGAEVQGDLYLVGGGDATLSRAAYPPSQPYQDPPQPFTSLDALADRVAATGVRRVSGRLVGDESRYDTERFIPQWQPVVVEDGEAGPLSALLVDDGKVAVEDRLPAPEPALTAVEVFRSLLEDRGIEIAGGVAVGIAPADAPGLVSIESAPMTDVVREMMTTSDDNTAELLLKELGLVAGTGPTTTAGLDVVRQTLTGWGIPLDGVQLFDGSGLSNANRLRCSTLLGVLDHMGGVTGPYFDALPIAATTGTLREEFVGSPLAGDLRAKTGSLDIAKSLSGYIPGPGGHWVSFSLVLNGVPGTPRDRYEAIWRALANGLDTIPERVDPATLAPPS